MGTSRVIPENSGLFCFFAHKLFEWLGKQTENALDGFPGCLGQARVHAQGWLLVMSAGVRGTCCWTFRVRVRDLTPVLCLLCACVGPWGLRLLQKVDAGGKPTTSAHPGTPRVMRVFAMAESCVLLNSGQRARKRVCSRAPPPPPPQLASRPMTSFLGTGLQTRSDMACF